LPTKVRRQFLTLLEGGFVERSEHVLDFGLASRGKTHFWCALERELVLRRDKAVYLTPMLKLVQLLLAAAHLSYETQFTNKDFGKAAWLGIDGAGAINCITDMCAETLQETPALLFEVWAEVRAQMPGLDPSSNWMDTVIANHA